MIKIKTVFCLLLCVLSSIAFCQTDKSKKNKFTLTSTAFLNKATLPKDYTCDGKDISPPLAWTHVPPGTQSFALTMKDPDAENGTWYHWVIYNLPNTMTSVPEDAGMPRYTLLGRNSWGGVGYRGACPPEGKAHRYIFTVYAVNAQLGLLALQSGELLTNFVKSHTLGKAELMAKYARETD